MEKKEDNSGSVYVTADKDENPVHISTKGKGDEGFMDFMSEDIEKVLKQKEIPTQ